MTYETWLPILFVLSKPGAVLAQERMYEWHWEMHPMWWWGWAMMAMMFLFWVLFIVGLIVGIRWLVGKGKEQKQDSALRSCVRDMRGARSTKTNSRPRRKILADKE